MSDLRNFESDVGETVHVFTRRGWPLFELYQRLHLTSLKHL